MRYILGSSGYLQEVSFGAVIQCNGTYCTEYTGKVPSGYDDLVDWFIKEGDKLYRWKIAEGHLTLDSNVPIKSEPGAVFAPAGTGYEKSPIVLKTSLVTDEDDLDAIVENLYSKLGNNETRLIRFYGYPSTSDYNWFGFLFKSSANYGSMVVHSAYGRGTLMTKTKVAGVWQPIEPAGVVQTLLWENKKLTEDFPAKTIDLDLKGYDAVYVEAIRSTDDNTISGRTHVQVGGLPGYLMGTTDQFALTRRKVSATATGVTFSGFSSANTSNGASNEIPYRIYGIKGVAEVADTTTEYAAICGEIICGETVCG